MNDYALVTEWSFAAPLQTVWDALCRSEDWPAWWRFVKQVQIVRPGGTGDLPDVRRYRMKTLLPYELGFVLTTTVFDPPHRIEAEVSGDLQGHGACLFFCDGQHTRVRIDWRVRTCKPWMNWLAPVVRPVFIWNHQKVMQAGGAALARRLEAAPEK